MWVLVHPGLCAAQKKKEKGEKKLNLRLDYQNQYKHLMDEVHPIS
jgi:hypothetical protein